MPEEYCFDISFPTVDFDIYMLGHEKTSNLQHAHLICRENEIEIKIFYKPNTYFGNKLSHWASGINWKYFGKYLKIENERKDSLQKIDLSESVLLKISNGSNQFEKELKFVSILLNSVKLYWDVNDEEINSGEFYLNDAGFDVVKDYYAPLFGSTETFEISRMNGMGEFYSINSAKFRPEFDFHVNDSRNFKEAKIIKEPKFQFKYSTNTTEQDAFMFAETVMLLTSFYIRTTLDFTVSRIHLREYTIVHKKIQDHSNKNNFGNLWAFGCELNYDSFMKYDWQKSVFQNYEKLSKAIEMFIQAISVDSNSRFLLLYNIIEVCMGGSKEANEKFETTVTSSELEKKYNDALLILLETIKQNDHADFTNKWTTARSKLLYKPMKSPLLLFLESQGLEPEKFPIDLNALKKMRDKITHGSTNINRVDLESANTLLYRITGILILNQIGITDWKLNTHLPN